MTLSMKEIQAEAKETGGKTPLLRVKELGERFPESIALRNKEFGICMPDSTICGRVSIV